MNIDERLRELSIQLRDLQDMKGIALEEYHRSGCPTDYETVIDCNNQLLSTYEKIENCLEGN